MNAKLMTAHASLARTGMAWAEIAELSASTWATLVVNIDCLGGLHTYTHTRGQEVDEAGDAGAERFLKTQLNSSFVWHVKQMSSVLCKKKKTEISKATAAAESAYEVRKSNNRNC